MCQPVNTNRIQEVNRIMKLFQVIVSSKENFNIYYVVSSYDALKEAQDHYEQDLKDFQIKHRKFWLSECYGYNAIIKDGSIAA